MITQKILDGLVKDAGLQYWSIPKVGRSIERYGRLDPAAELVEIAFVFRPGLLHGQHGSKVAAGTDSHRTDAVWIEVILLGIGTQPAHDSLNVIDLGWMPMLGSQTIVA